MRKLQNSTSSPKELSLAAIKETCPSLGPNQILGGISLTQMPLFCLPQALRVGAAFLEIHEVWVQGFTKKIGTTNCLLAELWALKDGLSMARNMCVEKLIVNVDALEVVNLLSNTKATNRLTQPIVDACRTFLQAFQEVQLQHCYRETNKAADFLAKLRHSLSEPFVYYMTPPFGIMEVLSNDANAVLYNRASRVVTTEFM